MNKHVSSGAQPRDRRLKQKPAIKLIREIEDIDEKKFYLEVRSSGRTIIIPRSDFRHPERLQDKLLDGGANFYFAEKEAVNEIKEALLKPPFLGKINETARTGWHGNSFVWQGGTHGESQTSLRLRPDENSNQDKLFKGALPAWKSGLEKPCEYSSILVFALALGFAAPFLRFVSPNEGATFYIWGKTTTGKTVAKRALMSILHRAIENDLMTFDITNTKLDEEAEAYNDLVLVLNESERLKKDPAARAQAMRDIAYKIAGGTGRQVSKAAVRNFGLKNRKWLVFCLSSGETTAKTADRNEGEEIRLVDIPVPKSETGGIFYRHKKSVA